MPFDPTQGKTAVALFADGLTIRYVQMSMKGQKVTLRDFKTAPLVSRLEEKSKAEGMPSDADMAGLDSFGDGGVPALDAASAGESSNTSVLLGFISDLPSAKYSFNFAISEPSISYQEFDSNFGLQGDKLKKKLIEEILKSRGTQIPKDSLRHIPTASQGVLAVVREGGIPMFDLLQDTKSFLPGRLPKVERIESSDIALMSLVRGAYDCGEEEITAIVYVGNEFTRIIFLRGKEYLHFAPLISEGYNSPGIENTIYSRIILEQDNIGLGRMDRIILAGEAHKIELVQFLSAQFSNSNVSYLAVPELDISSFEQAIGDIVAEYAIPIAVAWTALNPKVSWAYDTNLLSAEIVESQKAFKLAWHGWLITLASVASIAFLITQITDRNREIGAAEDELRRKRVQIGDLETLNAQKDMLVMDINRFSIAATVYDSIVPGNDRWTRILHYLGSGVNDLNSIWITRAITDGSDAKFVTLTGRSLFRERITRFARLFEKASIRSMKTIEVRGKIFYEFEILIELVDKTDQQTQIPRALGGN